MRKALASNIWLTIRIQMKLLSKQKAGLKKLKRV